MCSEVNSSGFRTSKIFSSDELVNGITFSINSKSSESGDPILTATEKGYGKRTQLEEYRAQARGGSGVISIKTSDRNGQVVGAIQVTDEDEMMLISDKGTLVRARASDVSIIGRNTQGVTLINIADDEALVSVAKIAETEDEDSDQTDDRQVEE